MDKGGGLQLIPDTKRTVDIKRPGENRFLIIGIIIAVLFIGLNIGVTLYKQSYKSKIEKIDQDLTTLEASRDKNLEKKIRTLDSQMSVVRTVLDDHFLWTQAFGKIENKTRLESEFVTLSANIQDEKINIKAKTSTYTAVAKQIAAFLSEESIKDISLNKVNTSPAGGIEFSLTVLFDSSKFLKQKSTPVRSNTE